jgi:hypothetical protein
MAKIVLGIGTSHGPMLSTPPEHWNLRVEADKRMRHPFRDQVLDFDEMVAARADENMAAQITPEVWRQRHTQCRCAIAKLAQLFDEVKPDIAVIVGNDQMEIFNADLVPAFSVLWGDQIINSEYTPQRMASLPPGVAVSVSGHIPPGGAVHAAVPDLGKHLTESLIASEFDITALKRLPGDETPHAFGFIFRQIMSDRVIPTVPVLINTFYPPNQPTAKRCADFGRALFKAIDSWDSNLRVAVFASGGLTHFAIDETIDQAMLSAITDHDISRITRLDESVFQEGTSELKNWIPVASAMEAAKLQPTVVDYVPCYRSLAGTGNAMAFVHWLPKD